MPRQRHSTSGQDLVEYALILPLLLLLLLAIMELGIIVFQYNSVASAAREVARYGVIFRNDEARIQEFITSELPNRTPGLNPAALTVSPASGTGTYIDGDLVGVIVTYDTQLITAPIIQAFGIDGTIRLTSIATMRRE